MTPPSPADLLTGQLAAVLGVDAQRIDTGRPLTELGLEPGTATLLRKRLQAAGADLSIRRLLGGDSVRSLSALLTRAGARPASAPDTRTPLDGGLRARFSSHAEHHGLDWAEALFAAVVLTVARWTCGTGVLDATAEEPADETVRVPAPDLLHWAGFAAYARELRAAAPGPVAILRSVSDTVRLRLRPPSSGRTVLRLELDLTGPLPGIRWETDGADAPGDVSLATGLHIAFGRLVSVLADGREAWRRIDLGWDPTFAFPEPLDVRPFPDADPLLDGPLRAAAERTPQSPALLDSSGALTHGQLARRAAHVAELLARADVRPGSSVAVLLPKGFDQIAAVTGVARHGGVYVPVDAAWPATRIAAVCRRARIAHALVPSGSPAELPGHVAPIILDAAPEEPADARGGTGGPPVTDPGAPAYTIFTSGSTGEPKGVVVDHAAARVTVDDITDRLGIGPQDRVLGLSALSFDLSVYDIFGVLGAGGALVLPEPGGEQDPQHWLDLIEQHRVTFWNTAPALMQMLLDSSDADPASASRQLASLRCVLLSGDWIPVTLPDRLRALVPGVEVVSAGGATEAAIWSICHPVGRVPAHWRSIPYGRPLRDQFFHILDDEGRPVPVGYEGELHIAGRGLARGYAGDEEQTAARFPVHEQLGERVYRTGDMGMWRTDGAIEFLGRKDRQVKIRGHRIELGEIESVLDRLPAVRRAIASVVREVDGRPRLLAHAALAPEALARPTEAVRTELVDSLRRSVPSYMVPNRIVLTESLPITANGKVDQARLSEVPDLADTAASSGPPRGQG